MNIMHTLKRLFAPVCLALSLADCSSSLSPLACRLPDYPVPGGVSAPFAGFVGRWLVVGGGCNFPDIPAAEGGQKVYYPQMYALDMTDSAAAWCPVGELPLPVAYGASVETEKGLVCIGGQCADSSLTQVFRIEPTDNGRRFAVRSLPPLPETVDNAAAACTGGVIYVTGGNQGRGGCALYSLRPDVDSTWTRLADYPGGQRVQPVLLAAGKTLCLAGGFMYDKESNRCTLPASLLAYSVETDEWSAPIPFPAKADGGLYALSGGSGVSVGGKLYLTGGVDYRIFKQAMEGRGPADYLKKPVEWYSFNRDILVYDTARGTWQVCPAAEGMGKAGGILLHHEGRMWMVCGEVKPGIRTPQVVGIPLPD